MKKKLISIFALLTISTMMLVGCGGTDDNSNTTQDTSVAEDTSAEDTQEESQDTEQSEEVQNVNNNTDDTDTSDDELGDALQELANTLDGTIWVGTDADSNIYALGFNGTSISISMVESDSTQTDLDGFWNIDGDNIYIYSDEAMTDEVTSFAWDFEDYDGTNLIYLDDACLAQTSPDEASDLATAVSQMNVVNDVISYIADGTYWVGSDETTVAFFSFDGANCYMYMVDMTTSEEMTFQGAWGLDYDNFYMVDSETGNYIQFGWDIASDGSEFDLIDDNGETLAFSQTDATDVDSALALVDEYLNGASNSEE